MGETMGEICRAIPGRRERRMASMGPWALVAWAICGSAGSLALRGGRHREKDKFSRRDQAVEKGCCPVEFGIMRSP
jgi:hypothetical protein